VRRGLHLVGAVAGGFLLAGCHGRRDMSVFDPVGPQSAQINSLWWLFFWVTAIVYVLTMAFFGIALFKGGRPADPEAPRRTRRAAIAVSGAMGVTVILLFVLLASDLTTGHSIASLSSKNAVTIEITGRQWWWEARYSDPVASNIVTTANEIHVPVGEPVVLLGTSRDVIHSFWAPNIHGKRDLIPGYQNAMWIRVDQPGTYRGQCAEFCGHQHAHMAFYIVAEPREQFRAWLEAQRKPAQPPQTDEQRQGLQVFLANDCVVCHTVRGTDASGRIGPDLTHLASRGNIAAGTLPFNTGSLAGWILDPQNIKPGNRMPQHALSGDDLQALLAYLENLK
jgi:cytochrome c oxidase subunit II